MFELLDRSNARVATTTIVVTRRRVDLLQRALRSLEAQDLVHFDILVIVDDCPLTCRFLETYPAPKGAVRSFRWIRMERRASDHSGPKRLATLRNLGLQMVKTQWCSFLDDDNELEPSHMSSLFECIVRSDVRAAHSWRSLWTRDGKPFFLSDRHLWCRDPELAKRLFSQYKDAGIYEAGCNIVRDQVVPYRRVESMVDMSEWFFETEFIRSIGFVSDYCVDDWETSRTEDSKLLDYVVASGLEIPSTRKPSLRYHLGGYSNDWSNEAAEREGWR